MRIRITHDYDYVTPQKTIAFKEGDEVTVTKDVASDVLKARKGVEVKEDATTSAKASGGSAGGPAAKAPDGER